MCGTSLLLYGLNDYERLTVLPLGQGSDIPLWVGSGVSFLAMNPFESTASLRVRGLQAAALATVVTVVVAKTKSGVEMS